MDRGFTELHPDYMKLDFLRISPEIQHKLIEGLEKLLNLEGKLEFDFPKVGKPNPYDFITISNSADKNLSKFGGCVCRFYLAELPGCCGILVSYQTHVWKEYRNKGINTFLQEIKEDIARENGFTRLMATTIDSNDAEKHILEKTGWKEVDRFVNRRSGNTVITYVKDVKYNEKGE